MRVMNTMARTFRYAVIMPGCLLVALAAYNSYRFNTASPLTNDFNIKLTKRLDETFGQIKFGRNAASLNPNLWKKQDDSKLVEKVNAAVREKFKPLLKSKKEVIKEEQAKAAPEPAVAGDLDLELTGGIVNKKVLKNKLDYSGSAKVVDGVIEEINVSLPGGREFTINTRERMVGNVFQYEDTRTRELRSGLFYEVKKGSYMITLTDDTQYGGIRLEFQSPSDAQVDEAVYSNDQSWAMNDQNTEQAQEDYAQDDNLSDDEYAQNDNDSYGYQYDQGSNQNQMDQDIDQNDSYEEQVYDDIKQTTSPYSHSFGV
ncbi:MAG: hypothetical protein CME65_11980 [Halobacteriovoraceae bacterium]|nr:hypothetical protein [Halobacteriovoraceae bacterium]